MEVGGMNALRGVATGWLSLLIFTSAKNGIWAFLTCSTLAFASLWVSHAYKQSTASVTKLKMTNAALEYA
jgi:hypothetical protein